MKKISINKEVKMSFSNPADKLRSRSFPVIRLQRSPEASTGLTPQESPSTLKTKAVSVPILNLEFLKCTNTESLTDRVEATTQDEKDHNETGPIRPIYPTIIRREKSENHIRRRRTASPPSRRQPRKLRRTRSSLLPSVNEAANRSFSLPSPRDIDEDSKRKQKATTSVRKKRARSFATIDPTHKSVNSTTNRVEKRRNAMRRVFTENSLPRMPTSSPSEKTTSRSDLSLLSPRYSASRNHFPLYKDSRTDIQREKIAEIETITHKREASIFNKRATKCLLDKWSLIKGELNGEYTPKEYEMYHLSIAKLNKILELNCKDEMQQVIETLNGNQIAALSLTHTPRVNEMITIIQKSGILLTPIINRLILFRDSLNQFHFKENKKTEWTDRLSKNLDILTEPETTTESYFGVHKGKDLHRFLMRIDNLTTKKVNKKVWKIIREAFGDDQKSLKENLAFIKLWSSGDREVTNFLKSYLGTWSWKLLQLSTIPYIQHDWIEAESAKHPLEKITPYEIVRCLYHYEDVLLKKITINGKTFHAAESPKKFNSSEEFFIDLFTALYLEGVQGKDTPTDETIKEQVLSLFKASKEGNRDCKDIPDNLLNILRLCSNSTWGHADGYIRKIYSTFFEIPYWTKLKQGIECEISITNETVFNVTIKRGYAIHKRIKEHDPDSYAVVDTSLASIPFLWNVIPYGETWKGSLRIADNITINKATSKEDKWKIYDSILDWHEMEESQDEYEEGAPRLSSKRRLSLMLGSESPVNT